MSEFEVEYCDPGGGEHPEREKRSHLAITKQKKLEANSKIITVCI